ncbi:UNVERIFIED_CONTAM: hypothetical protein FKN15_033046 [Acipenser sinensis]
MNTRCPPKRVPSAARFFTLCRLTMQPPQSYSVGGQRSSGQLTGKPAGARPDYRGRWCAVSRGHSGRPNPPSPRATLGQLRAAPLGAPDHGRLWNSLDSNSQLLFLLHRGDSQHSSGSQGSVGVLRSHGPISVFLHQELESGCLQATGLWRPKTSPANLRPQAHSPPGL